MTGRFDLDKLEMTMRSIYEDRFEDIRSVDDEMNRGVDIAIDACVELELFRARLENAGVKSMRGSFLIVQVLSGFIINVYEGYRHSGVGGTAEMVIDSIIKELLEHRKNRDDSKVIAVERDPIN